jgi:ribosomal protein S12
MSQIKKELEAFKKEISDVLIKYATANRGVSFEIHRAQAKHPEGAEKTYCTVTLSLKA